MLEEIGHARYTPHVVLALEYLQYVILLRSDADRQEN